MDTLKILRVKADLTQDEVTERTGINQGTISGIETGRINPSDEQIRLLARAYRVKISEFKEAME